MFCGKCGKFVEEGNKFCTGCGEKITPIGSNVVSEQENANINVGTSTNPIDLGDNKQKSDSYNKLNYEDKVVCKTEDKVNVWLVILGFLIPLVGLILFISLKKNTPKKANAIGIAALIGFVLGFVLTIIALIFVFIIAASNYSEYYDRYEDDYYYNEEYDYDYDFEFDRLEEELEKYYNENKI